MDKKSFNLGHLSSGVLVPLLILAAGAFGYFLAWPQMTSVSDSRAILAQKQADLYDRETSLTAIKKLVTQVDEEREQLAVVDEALPPAVDIPGLLSNLEFLARESGLALDDIQVQMPTESLSPLETETIKLPSGVKSVMISVAAVGQYPQLSAFILNLEQNLRLFDVQRIDFTGSGTGDATTGAQKYQVSMQGYYQENK